MTPNEVHLQKQIDELRSLLNFVMIDKYRFEKNMEMKKELKHTGTTCGLYNETPVAQASAIGAPSAPGAVYAQGEAQSAVNAINSIRTALQNIGITA